MKTPSNRRDFLSQVGRGMITATVGSSLAAELGLAADADTDTEAGNNTLSFGGWEPLVALMQETPADRLLPLLAEKLAAGVPLDRLVGAGALANARSFGGEDYIGFHTMMALAPSLHMARACVGRERPLPVLKVLYRNTARIQARGGRATETLQSVTAATGAPEADRAPEWLRAAVRAKDKTRAEAALAALAQRSPDEAFNALLHTVHDHTDVHRVVLPYRAWELLDVVGREHAHTLLRQSVRYCVDAERGPNSTVESEPRALLGTLMEKHELISRAVGTRRAEDAWVEDLSRTLFESSPADAAAAAAAALAEGFSPDAIGEAISLAANQLVLRDPGRTPRDESPGKPVGSVHGDSIGVHASDSANAWRNMARVANARNTFACLILGAYQVAMDRVNRGGDFLNLTPLPVQGHVDGVKATDPAALLAEADEAIRQNMQARAAAVVHRYGLLGHAPGPVFDLMLSYAISEDGSLHGEKYFRTASMEFAATRPTYRWRQLTALARVTASEYGRPAPGIAEARSLLKV